MIKVKVIDKKTMNYKIRDLGISDDKFAILCQRDDKDYNEIVQVPIKNVSINYSSFIKEPVMKLEVSKLALDGWHRIFYLGLKIEFEPIIRTCLDVPHSYKKILEDVAF